MRSSVKKSQLINMTVDCSKCDSPVQIDQRQVTCSTCQLSFHVECAKVSELKYEVLTEKNCDIYWFCPSCKLTTANMLNHLADVLQRMSSMEAEREKEKKEIATLQNLVRCFNEKVKKLEDRLDTNSTDIEATKSMVGEMLSSIPQVSSIENRFAKIDDKLEEFSQLGIERDFEIRMKRSDSSNSFEMSCNLTSYPDITSVAEVTNELQERNKRARSLVIHNLPEADNHEQEINNVSNLLHEILPDCQGTEYEHELFSQKPKVYRLGHKINNRVRSLKVHLKSAEIKDEIIAHARRLAAYENYRTVVIQKDMTPLE